MASLFDWLVFNCLSCMRAVWGGKAVWAVLQNQQTRSVCVICAVPHTPILPTFLLPSIHMHRYMSLTRCIVNTAAFSTAENPVVFFCKLGYLWLWCNLFYHINIVQDICYTSSKGLGWGGGGGEGGGGGDSNLSTGASNFWLPDAGNWIHRISACRSDWFWLVQF